MHKILVSIPDVPMRKHMMDHQNLIAKISEKAEISWNISSANYSCTQLFEALADSDILITSWGCPKIDKAFLQKTSLRFIGHVAGSLQYYFAEDIFDTGIRIVNGNAAFSDTLAEYSLMLMMMSLRNIYYYTSTMKTDNTFRNSEGTLERDLTGKTVGLIGYGTIARKLISYLKAFNTEILVCDEYCTQEEALKTGFALVSLEQAMSQSDVISIQHTLTDKTFKLIDKKALSLMKDNAVIVNTARGAIIDEQALVEELKKGRLFAALDVFEKEPLPQESKLRALRNVILSPHIAGKTTDCRKRMGHIVLSEILRYINGQAVDSITLDAYRRMSVH